MTPAQENVCSHVKVVVRVRPENDKERQGNFRRVVRVIDQHMLVFDPEEEEVGFFSRRRVTQRDVNRRQRKDLKFMFDTVFDGSSSQLEVFEHTTKNVIEGFLNGYNCTVLAYGATGAGKTHTMLGSPEDPGVMYLTMVTLYKRMDQIKDDKICDVAVSYLEVYNEQIRDLLVNSGPLAVREDGQQGVVVQGLTLHQPKSAEEILQMLDHGNRNRTQHPTDLNASSSRSHAVFQIYLRQQDKTASINQNVRIAKMSLIDLAGSERAKATSARGARFVEGTNINRSLLALGNVINALADPKSKVHIPYRNSKLTRLLKDSLGGNCRTIMIAAISPSSMFYDDTYNTLKYANRAKDIKSSLKSNVVSLSSHVSHYAEICKEQQKEILMLKEKLREYEEKQASIPEIRNTAELSKNQQVEIERYKEILKNIFAKRVEIRKEYLKVEKKLKENTLKKYYQNQCHEQIQLICCSEEKVVKATCKRDLRLSELNCHYVRMQKKREEQSKLFEENTKWLHRVENEMRLLGPDGCIPKELCQDLQYYHLNLEAEALKAQIGHMLTLVSLQDRYNKQTEKVLNTALPVLHKQHLMLKEAGLTNDLSETEYVEVEQLIQRQKSVAWADQIEEKNQNQNREVEMSAIFTFSQLVSRPNTPCSTPLGTPSQEMNNNPQQVLEHTEPPQKRTRRKLMDSPPLAPSPPASSHCSLQHLEDSLAKEVYPLADTPDSCRKPAHSLCAQPVVKEALHLAGLRVLSACRADVPGRKGSIMDTTCDVIPESHEALMNSTVILYEGAEETAEMSAYSSVKESQPCTSSIVQRNKNSAPVLEKPSYMAMTSAAQRKRKILSSTSNTVQGSLQAPDAAKRSRQDVLLSHAALRVPQGAGVRMMTRKQDQNMPRNFIRNLSQGNVPPDVKSRTSKNLCVSKGKK
ncbi:kinesin-like protein KIF18A isoform X1 [Passer montanus]|uniref:kinesin-like protein KIF18A isoform X1 n=2 Tax=Passer montanus TaxID=9160 RepID=UPI0019620ADC|nr:kinesin-like protein KIF18A isoform X1 [Passer montanus]XP_039581112.1 kinesin-like protein KIF18A isoform X1 [Passer montanus]XP_039581113.1 kinesin-like protein KIF18A isoform X1 [Passer montanus]